MATSGALEQLHEQALNGLLAMWAYFTPAVALCGIVMNLAICILMPFTALSRKTRLFYTVLAFLDIGPLVFHNVFMFSGFGLLYATNGSTYVQFESLSNVACLLHRAALRSSESVANTVLTLFALERMYAIRYPFQAHLITFAKTVMAIGSIAVVNSCAIWWGTFHLYALEGAALGVARYVLTTTFNLVTIATLLQRRRNMKNQFECNVISHTELSNALVVIIISGAHFVTAIPYSILFFASLLGTGVKYSLLRIIANYFVVFLGVIHAANFVIYSLRLKAFRDMVLCRKNMFSFNVTAATPNTELFLTKTRPIHRSISITGLTRFTYEYSDSQRL